MELLSVKAGNAMEELRSTLKLISSILFSVLLCTDSFHHILQLSVIYVWSQEIAHSRTQCAYFVTCLVLSCSKNLIFFLEKRGFLGAV